MPLLALGSSASLNFHQSWLRTQLAGLVCRGCTLSNVHADHLLPCLH
jgi:hypothetical protein